ncbi:hypothetical protein MKK88_19105 [Methylobacterium sp. E-005]|jgi:hypothetical protein|uniref:hypothetical protein n=1 Tax=Methylobacterium sp. E-005 TaxID=2836549 RepID=UPI001FB9C9A1|nr:hypothetical protein [Methylobacterium sp. E-005]MCJ2088074.1 hypothetical protein [Methylobacterium sp. E-005]
MNIISWLISMIIQFFIGSGDEQRNTSMAKEKEAGLYVGETSAKATNFEDDYHAATNMLKLRMDKNFPDNYHARLSSGENSPYDHGEDRALAVDTTSTAIAMALRSGATVRQAAEAGAVSVGI